MMGDVAGLLCCEAVPSVVADHGWAWDEAQELKGSNESVGVRSAG